MRMNLSRLWIWVVLYIGFGVQYIFAQSFSTPLDRYNITLPSGHFRQFVFTNKAGAYWYGEANRQNQQPDQGYHIASHRYLIDYTLYNEQEKINRNSAKTTLLYPNRLERNYGDIRETLFFLDSLNALLVHLTSATEGTFQVEFRFDDRLKGISWEWDQAHLLATADIPEEKVHLPHVAGIKVWGDFHSAALLTDEAVPGSLALPKNVPSAVVQISNLQQVFVLILFEKDMQSLSQTIRAASHNPQSIIARRVHRYRELLSQNLLQTHHAESDNAYARALFSLDDLGIDGQQPGIWSGIPGKNMFRARETFISLTGALLCTGNFALAREILLSFAETQNRDLNSPHYGQIAEALARTGNRYTGADITPWFVIACDKYVKYTGDTEFINDVFPVIKKAMEGALQNHVDEYGFLIHGDGETWMNARSSQGYWTPRGSKAVEIQALWMEQVRISRTWAEMLGYTRWAQDWKLLENRLRLNFKQHFWDQERYYLKDYLTASNQPQNAIRPNGILAAAIPQRPVLTEEQVNRMLEKVYPRIVFPWGVATLTQDDANFRPYHDYRPHYQPEAALHNGLIWKWLNGPLISLVAPANSAAAMTILEYTAREILTGNAPGTLTELTEAWPREEEHAPATQGISSNENTLPEISVSGKKDVVPRGSGAFSSAPALAEFIRNWHEDVLGIHPDWGNKLLTLTPHLPAALEDVSFKTKIGGVLISGRYVQSPDHFSITLESSNRAPEIVLTVSIPLREKRISFDVPWSGKKRLQIDISRRASRTSVTVNGKSMKHRSENIFLSEPKLTMAEPLMDFSIPSLQRAQYVAISAADGVKRHGRLTPLLFDIKDDKEDDRGPGGNYSYPLNAVFEPGIFDVRRVRIRRDNSYFYFEIDMNKLVNPSGAAAPGFEYTFLAITLNFEKFVGVRSTRLLQNANFSLPYEYGFNYVIYVGNGYMITDARGNIIAQYRPSPTDPPMASVKKKKIRFSVPVKYLSTRFLRNAVVLSGGWENGTNDIGEFRDVYQQADSWHGGGGERQRGNPNIYDIVFIRR